MHAARPLAHGLDYLELIKCFDLAAVGASQRRSAREDDHRRSLRTCGRDARERVCETWARGDNGDARLTGGQRPTFGAMCCRGFVTHIDESNVVARSGPPRRIDVTAAQTKEMRDAVSFQRARDQVATVDDAHNRPSR